MPNNDLASLVPATVEVAFPSTADGLFTGITTPISVTLASRALAEFKNITGAPWTKVLHRYEIAEWEGTPNGSSSVFINKTTLTALAKQVATDWYRWQLEKLDVQYVGSCPWNPDGLEDIEWRQSAGVIATRIIRGPFNPPEDLLFRAPALVGNNSLIPNLYVTNNFYIYNDQTYQTYFSYTINYVTNTSVINIYNTIINGDPVWGNPVIKPIVTEVCYYPFTYQWVQVSTILINAVATTLITANFILAEPTIAYITAHIETFSGAAGDTATATLKVDGVAQTLALNWTVPFAPNYQSIVSQAWVVTLAAGSHTVVLSATCAAASISSLDDTNLVVHCDGVLRVEQTDAYFPNGTEFGAVLCATNPQSCCDQTISPGGSGTQGGSPVSGTCSSCSGLWPISANWKAYFKLTGCTSGGYISTSCCTGGLPASINLIFTGSFSSLGTVTVTYNHLTGLWSATLTANACGDGGSGTVFLVLECIVSDLYLIVSTPTETLGVAIWAGPHGCTSGTAADYAHYDGSAGHACAGSFGVSIDYGTGTFDYSSTGLALTESTADPCCWSGTSGSLKVTMCLQANADGTTTWIMRASYHGQTIAEWRFDEGTADVDCCATVTLKAVASSCATVSVANVVPQDSACGGGGTGSTGGGGTFCCSMNANTILIAAVGRVDSNGNGLGSQNVNMTYDGSKYFTGTWNPPCGGPIDVRLWNNLAAGHCEFDYSCDGGVTWTEVAYNAAASQCSPTLGLVFDNYFTAHVAMSGCGGCDGDYVEVSVSD